MYKSVLQRINSLGSFSPRRIAPWIFVFMVCGTVYQKSWDSLNPYVPEEGQVLVSSTHANHSLNLPQLSRWLVVDVRDHPEACIRLAAGFQKWKVLLFGIDATDEYNKSRCINMASAKDSAQRSRLQADSISTFHYDQHLALLYAIKNGADVIYIPSASTDLLSLENPVIVDPGQIYDGMTYAVTGDNIFDTNMHFGCNISLTENQMQQSADYQICEHMYTSAIQTATIVGPLRQVSAETIDRFLQQKYIRYCDHTAPSVALAPGSFSPLHLTDTTYTRAAFWALPVLMKEPSKFQEVLSLVIQRLLWMTSSFNGSNVVLLRNSDLHDKITSGYLERTLKLRQHLLQYTSNKTSFFECATELMHNLVKLKFIDSYHKDKFMEWQWALRSVDYKFPDLIDKTLNEKDKCNGKVIFYPVNYSVNLTKRHYSKKICTPVANVVSTQKLYDKVCNGDRHKARIDLSKPWIQYDDVLLIVVFNNYIYESLPFVEALYRSFFPNILYCGPGHIDSQKFPGLKDLHITFVSYGENPPKHMPGSFSYECLTYAVKMNYNLQGYLTIADDMFLPIHTLQKKMELYKKTVWFIPNSQILVTNILNVTACDLGSRCMGWPWFARYKQAIVKVFATFKQLQNESSLVHRCYTQLQKSNGGDMSPSGGFPDIYYIPQRLASDFSQLAKIFLEHRVFVSVAVPSIIRCLESPQRITTISGKTLWQQNRKFSSYTMHDIKNANFLHPTKWSKITKDGTAEIDFYCKKAMLNLHKPLRLL